MQTFEIPTMRDRLDVHSFVMSCNNSIVIYAVLSDLLVNMQQNQELAQLEFDLSLLELQKTSSQNLSEETANIKQKLADIETLKVKNFKHNNQEEVKTIKFIQSVLDKILDHIIKMHPDAIETFHKFKHDTYIGCIIQQNIYAIDADCRIDPESRTLHVSKQFKIDSKEIINQCLILEELPKTI